jgi:hypothetical protein
VNTPRNRLSGVLFGLAVIGGIAYAAPPAAAYTIENRLDIQVNARVNPGGFDKNIPRNGRESAAASVGDAMLTAEIQTANYNCVIPIQGNGTVRVEYHDEGGGANRAIVCTSIGNNGNQVAKLPYVSTPGTRSIRFLATADPQIENGDNQGPSFERFRASQVMTQLTNKLKADSRYRGLLIAGDLTMNSNREEFDFYLNTIKGMSRFVYDGVGNHDFYQASDLQKIGGAFKPGILPIPEEIRENIRTRKRTTPKSMERGHHYSWDWSDVHFVQLNLYPGNSPGKVGKHDGSTILMDPFNSLQFLADDLRAKVGTSGRPVVLMHHYGLEAFSCQDDWWTAAERNAYWDVIADYNVIAIITGHIHNYSNKDGSAVDQSWWDVPWTRPAGKRNGPDQIRTLVAGGAREGGYYIDVEITGDKLIANRYRWNNLPAGLPGVEAFPAVPNRPKVEYTFGIRKPSFQTVVLVNRFTGKALVRTATGLQMGDPASADAKWVKLAVPNFQGSFQLALPTDPTVGLTVVPKLGVGKLTDVVSYLMLTEASGAPPGFGRLNSYGNPAFYLHIERQGVPEYSLIEQGWWSAQWKLEQR